MSCGLHMMTRYNHMHCQVLARDKFYFRRQSQTWDWAAVKVKFLSAGTRELQDLESGCDS